MHELWHGYLLVRNGSVGCLNMYTMWCWNVVFDKRTRRFFAVYAMRCWDMVIDKRTVGFVSMCEL